MSLRQLQQSIAQWGRDTFHRGRPAVAKRVATRMNKEVAELLEGLDLREDTAPGSEDRRTLDRELGLECADIFIMLVQVADALDMDLMDLQAFKMEVNRQRHWGRTSTGSIQHVERGGSEGDAWVGKTVAELEQYVKRHEIDPTRRIPGPVVVEAVPMFKEEGSGHWMRPDRWYILSDTGTLEGSREGYTSSTDAWAWCLDNDHLDAVIPTWEPESHSWRGQDGLNIYKGQDLHDFWAHDAGVAGLPLTQGTTL